MNETEFRSLVWSLVAGISLSRLYNVDHEAVGAAARRALALIQGFPDGKCSLMVIKGDLVLNNRLFRDSGVHGEKLVRLLAQKGVSRVDFLPGLGEEELLRLLDDLGRKDDPPGSYPHLRLGSVEVGVSLPAAGGAVEAAWQAEQLGRVKDVYAQVSPFRDLPVVGLAEIVGSFLVTFRRGANLLRLISPVKTHSDHTYAHAVNVSVLAMGLAERVGLKDQAVQDIGVAALMHDVGKLLVPLEVLHKPGALSKDEFAVMRQHPLFGAAYLARAEGITRLAVLAALEHHRRYDNTGYPTLRDSGRRQHAVSQIVAIADVYDALRSHRPYKRSLEMDEILAMMEKESGTAYNPALLGVFTAMMLQAAAEG